MNELIFDLTEKSAWVWKKTLEIHRSAPETRLASSLSSVEIFVALYYGGIVQTYPNNPQDVRRDRCIISKGHGSICMYPILADLGFFSIELLQSVCKRGSFLGGIPDPMIPGYETVNGSLGHGLGVGTGMAIGLKRKNKDNTVFVVTGDGELQEGANWEAIMFASQHRLDNLVLVVDDNRLSMLGPTAEIVPSLSLSRRLTAFGWECSEVDGHNVYEIYAELKKKKRSECRGPKAIIAKTVKGRGVPGLENEPLSHVINPKRDIIDRLLGNSL